MIGAASATSYELLEPQWLALLVAVPLAWWWRSGRGAPAVRFADAAVLQGLPRSWRQRWRGLPGWLEAVGLVLLAVAIARPVEKGRLPLQTQGVDIFLCIDTSSSMAARDMDATRTRLAVAKDAARQFVRARPDDRIGLLTFARYADLLCPLTLNHTALGAFLDSVEMVTPDGPEDMTGIGGAVARAAEVLKDSQAKSKVVILLTDGEENVAQQLEGELGPIEAGQLCKTWGVRAYTISAGIGYQQPSGDWIALDTGPVEELARTSGGEFFEARDAGGMARVYAAIDELEKVAFEEPQYRVEERFAPVVLGALVALVLSHLLRRTWLGEVA